MDKITQEAHFRQRVLKYAAEHGVSASANRHRLSRKTVHKWKKRYNGTLESLKDRPRTPHHFPKQQKAEEYKLVRRYAKKYRGDLLFKEQAERQRTEKHLYVEDGWNYFIYGWTQVISEVFHLPIDGEMLEKLSEAAKRS